MKTRLFFDTETNGLPVRQWAPETDLKNWPRLVQLAGAVYEDERLFHEFNFIIKPEGWIIPDDAAEIHGITTATALEQGRDLSFVLREFTDYLNLCDEVICHNTAFDLKVVAAELIRMNIENDLMQKPATCTMKAGLIRCNLHNRMGNPKNPKLVELHKTLFGVGFEDAHNALTDVRATVKCYFEMRRKEWIK